MNVKEVWMYGYHSSHIAPDESKMSSRYGDIANDWPKDDFIPEAYRMPRCNNSYTLYNFAYNPGGSVGNDAHNRMHQIENVIFFAENRGYPVSAANYRGSIFNDDFSEWFDIFPPNRESFRSSCGNTHFTPNWTSLSNEYNYWLTNYREFNCETWHPDDSRTTYINANCERWGCTPLGFYQWFMQNMPGFQNGIEYQGQTMKNWWEAFYDFNAFIDNGHSLYGSSIFACPTPTLTPSPILQLTSGWNRITWPNINGKITSDLPTVCPIMVNYYNGKTSIFVRNYGSTSVNFIPGDIYFLNCSSPTVWQL
jgi:hypothetical protein